MVDAGRERVVDYDAESNDELATSRENAQVHPALVQREYGDTAIWHTGHRGAIVKLRAVGYIGRVQRHDIAEDQIRDRYAADVLHSNGIDQSIARTDLAIAVGIIDQISLFASREADERGNCGAQIQEGSNRVGRARILAPGSGDIRAVFLCCPGGLSTLSVEGTLLSKDQDIVKIQDVSGKTYEISADLVERVEEVEEKNLYSLIYRSRWIIVSVLLTGFAVMLWFWFTRPELTEWIGASWGLTKQMLPLLLLGVFAAGLLLGRPGPGHEGVIPTEWVNAAVGGNSIRANLFAAIAGAFMYFATLTEVPILQGLMGAGMGKGPALALLLAGPALSLPNMLVIRSVMGTQKTVVFILLVIAMATVSGILFGTFF